MKAKYPMSKTVHVVCGIGNNGADGFSIINHDTFLQFPDEEKEHNIVVDAMFGIGLSRMLSEEWQKNLPISIM